ncbi:MAG: GH25 family lysozyme [Minicystis sp.]
MYAACAPAGPDDVDGDDTDTTEDEVRVCAAGTTLKGLDVSVYQGKVDWAKVKASGRSFAFARVSDGTSHLDTQFAANWAGIKAAGMVRGAYQFFRPSQDAVAQADLMVSKIGTLAPGDLPPVIDVEDDDGLSGTKVVNAVRTWVDRVKAKTGVDPIIYSASGFWNALPNTAQFAGQTLWVANYTTQCPSMPTPWKKWAFWQNSESGSVPGVTGHVDTDFFNGTLADLQALAKGSPAAAPACTTDADCNQGAAGTGLVCSNTGATAGHCIEGCHADTDCPGGQSCDESQSPWRCASDQPVEEPCPVLTFPSGIKIQTVKDAATTASYAGHLGSGQTAPACFLDVTNLHNPDTNQKYDISVNVAAHFKLSELVGTEVDQGWGHFVLVSPAAVAALEAFRVAVGGPVSVNSGYRGPKHQESVCESLCGDPLGCSGTCANNSRHMWGDGFDLPMSFYSSKYTKLACAAGFKFTYLESGTHLHVDQNPAYATCVMQ